MNFAKFEVRPASAEREGIMDAFEIGPLPRNVLVESGRWQGKAVNALAVVLALSILPAYSASLQDQAQTAAVTDGLTTLGGLALGAAEANPLGLVTIVAKAPMLAAVKKMPQDEQADWNAGYSAIWSGATANNLCIIGVILTAGAAAPFCPVVGVAWGLQKWNESATERELWAICREERAYWKNPQMPCDFFNEALTPGQGYWDDQAFSDVPDIANK
jgi:hypothetical protein